MKEQNTQHMKLYYLKQLGISIWQYQGSPPISNNTNVNCTQNLQMSDMQVWLKALKKIKSFLILGDLPNKQAQNFIRQLAIYLSVENHKVIYQEIIHESINLIGLLDSNELSPAHLPVLVLSPTPLEFTNDSWQAPIVKTGLSIKEMQAEPKLKRQLYQSIRECL